MSNVPHGAVVNLAHTRPLAESSQDVPMAEAAGKGERADADEPAEGGEQANGVDAGGAAEQAEDEAVFALAMYDPASFGAVFAEAVSASDLEANDSPITRPAAGVDIDDAKWDKCSSCDEGENHIYVGKEGHKDVEAVPFVNCDTPFPVSRSTRWAELFHGLLSKRRPLSFQRVAPGNRRC
jgi:hypothetical protein